MRTRSSPSRLNLVELGMEAGLSEQQLQLPKSELYNLLSTSYNVERLERRLNRESRNSQPLSDKGPIELTNEEPRRSKRIHRKRKRSSLENEDAVTLAVDDNSLSALKSPAGDELSETSSGKRTRASARKRVRKGKQKANVALNSKDTFTDDMDPITREPLGKYVFTFKRPYGKNGKFDAETLVDYILATGDFTEPETRIPFSPSDMKRLDEIVRNAGMKKGSVYEAINNQKRFQEEKVTRDSVIGLERCIGELVSEMLSIIDAVCDGRADPESAETRLLLNVFPVFAHYFTLLRGMDRDYATTCVKQYVTFIAGPPNRPTRNELGLRDSVLQFLMTF